MSPSSPVLYSIFLISPSLTSNSPTASLPSELTSPKLYYSHMLFHLLHFLSSPATLVLPFSPATFMYPPLSTYPPYPHIQFTSPAPDHSHHFNRSHFLDSPKLFIIFHNFPSITLHIVTKPASYRHPLHHFHHSCSLKSPVPHATSCSPALPSVLLLLTSFMVYAHPRCSSPNISFPLSSPSH